MKEKCEDCEKLTGGYCWKHQEGGIKSMRTRIKNSDIRVYTAFDDKLLKRLYQAVMYLCQWKLKESLSMADQQILEDIIGRLTKLPKEES